MRHRWLALIGVVLLTGVASCGHREEYVPQMDVAEKIDLRALSRKQKKIYDASLLVGQWQRGTEHELFESDGSGAYWDDADDVSRGEAQRFRWTLDSNYLVVKHRLHFGAVVPKDYMVTMVDSESLVYCDSYGDNYMWVKE